MNALDIVEVQNQTLLVVRTVGDRLHIQRSQSHNSRKSYNNTAAAVVTMKWQSEESDMAGKMCSWNESCGTMISLNSSRLLWLATYCCELEFVLAFTGWEGRVRGMGETVGWEARVRLRFDMLKCFVELIFYFILYYITHNVNVDPYTHIDLIKFIKYLTEMKLVKLLDEMAATRTKQTRWTVDMRA